MELEENKNSVFLTGITVTIQPPSITGKNDKLIEQLEKPQKCFLQDNDGVLREAIKFVKAPDEEQKIENATIYIVTLKGNATSI